MIYTAATPEAGNNRGGCSSGVLAMVEENAHQYLKHHDFMEDKCCFIRINNTDDLCFARVLRVIGMGVANSAHFICAFANCADPNAPHVICAMDNSAIFHPSLFDMSMVAIDQSTKGMNVHCKP
uniref:Uncharacterized protein n=1 Tax=Romanomermis culicivorax TaxID=13658 RepID=A0A915HZD1_ROMCU